MTWEQGESGNPAGRPTGIKDKRTAMRELLIPHAKDLVDKVVEMAKAGDSTALRICMDRLIPPAKSRDDPVRLPELGGSLAEKGVAVLAAIGDERLTPEEAATILQAIATQARIVEIDEIEKRLTALEQSAGKPKGNV